MVGPSFFRSFRATAASVSTWRRGEWVKQADSIAGLARPTIKLDLADAPVEAVGQTLGRHKLLERVGEGGCVVVYSAEQTQPVRRRVHSTHPSRVS